MGSSVGGRRFCRPAYKAAPKLPAIEFTCNIARRPTPGNSKNQRLEGAQMTQFYDTPEFPALLVSAQDAPLDGNDTSSDETSIKEPFDPNEIRVETKNTQG